MHRHRLGESHSVAGPSALIGASSKKLLAPISAEGPAMLLVVRLVNRSKRWYEAGATG